MDNALLLGGVKAAVKIASGMRSVYADTGLKPDELAIRALKDKGLRDALMFEEPPVAEGFVRLYRGEPKDGKGSIPDDPLNKGYWFTTDKEAAAFYGNLKYVDVREAVAASAEEMSLGGEGLLAKKRHLEEVIAKNKARASTATRAVTWLGRTDSR